MKKLLTGITVLVLCMVAFSDPIPIPRPETDPVFMASDANGINSTDIGYWNTAYGWGDHSGLYDAAGTAYAAVMAHLIAFDHNDIGTGGSGDANAVMAEHLGTYDHNDIATAISWGDWGFEDFNDITNDDKINWNTAYTHSQDNTQAHSDYLLNTGDTATGDYNFDANTLFVDSVNNKIGVGTSSPTYQLTVLNTGSDASHLPIYMSKFTDSSGIYAEGGFVVYEAGTYMGGFEIYGSSAYTGSGWDSAAIFTAANNNEGKLIFRTKTGSTYYNRLFVENDGDIGIGTSTPDALLNVVSSSYPVFRPTRTDTGTNNRAGASCFLHTTTNNMVDNFGVSMDYAIKDNAGTSNTIASIGALRAGADNTGDIVLIPVAAGSGTERLRIKSDGSMVSLSTYSQAVGGTNKPLYIDNTGLIGYNSSSEKYKDNIRDYNDSSFIYDLTPRQYDRKDGSTKDEIGLIAEEVAITFPDAVFYKQERIYTPVEGSENNEQIMTYRQTNEPEGIDYVSLIVPLLAEVQKLNARVALLEKEVTELKKK